MLYTKQITRVNKNIPPESAHMYYNKTCAVCGDSFVSCLPKGKYCSQRCINDAYIIRRRKKAAKTRTKAKTCKVCATPITQDSQKLKAYCSNACKQKAYRERKQN